MLKDRKALLENEIRKNHKKAADLYLMMVSGTKKTVEDHSEEYELLKGKLADLRFELNLVDSLIAQGNQ